MKEAEKEINKIWTYCRRPENEKTNKNYTFSRMERQKIRHRSLRDREIRKREKDRGEREGEI